MGEVIDVAAEICKAFEEPANGLAGVVAGEVVGAEVVVSDAVAEHVIGGCQHGSGHGEDGLLGAAAGLDAQELGVQVAGFDAYRSPGGSDQGGLEPGAALAHARSEEHTSELQSQSNLVCR